MLRSPELDIYPPRAPELADLIDGSIGEGSPFRGTFGYYAQGVGHEKDFEYVAVALGIGLLNRATLDQRLAEIPGIDARVVDRAKRWLAAWSRRPGSNATPSD